MKLVTLTDASRELGIHKQILSKNIQRGVVSAKRYSVRCVMLDVDTARKELEASGFWMRSDRYKRRKEARMHEAS